MPVLYPTAVKNTRMDAVNTSINAGPAAGVLEIGTTGMVTVLATIPLADPAAPAAVGGVLTLTMPQSDASADATGTAAEARIRDSLGNDVITGLSVGLSGADVNLDSLSITAGQQVTINSATFTHG